VARRKVSRAAYQKRCERLTKQMAGMLAGGRPDTMPKPIRPVPHITGPSADVMRLRREVTALQELIHSLRSQLAMKDLEIVQLKVAAREPVDTRLPF
jgi:hypothetical protein